MNPALVPLEDYLRLGTNRIPQPNCLIKAPTGQGAAIGGKSHGIDITRMPLQRRFELAAVGVPQPDRLVAAAAGQRTAIGGKGYGIDRTGMSF